MSWLSSSSKEIEQVGKNTKTEQGNQQISIDCKKLLPENKIFADMLGKEILLTLAADQLDILGQTFRPIFCGKVGKVTNGYLLLDPAIIKMNNAPFYHFPTPLCFPIEFITDFVPFDCKTPFPIP